MGLKVTNFNIEDVYTTEEDKNKFEYLQKMIDFSIGRLVYEKKRIKKCRNLYEGVRDQAEFKYLEETFGIETPIAVKMTPLIKTRIDVLIGILLDEIFTYKITVRDEVSLEKIEEQKKNIKVDNILKKYREQLRTNINLVNNNQAPQQDVVTQQYLERVEELINEEFISSFEIAAQSLIQFFEQDLTIDLRQKIKQYFLDFLVTGEAYYRTFTPYIGGDPVLEIIKPENLFFNKNTNHQFISSGHEPHVNIIVHREYMRREQIVTRWGHLMTETDKQDLFGNAPSQSGRTNVIRSAREIEYNNRYREGLSGTHEQFTYDGTEWIPVYHVEWLANNEVSLTDEERQDLQVVEKNTGTKQLNDFYGKGVGQGEPRKKGYRLDRYEGIRVGENLYLNCGKSKRVTRSVGSPWKTTLSYNGVGYNERNGVSQSLAWNLKDLQDSYDIILFFRDNLIANSGVDGSRINLAAIPKVLGQDFMERLLKFTALRKQGLELIDPTEDGASLFQHYGDFKGSIDANVIVALNTVLETIQQQADVVSGVNRHMYQAAEVRDAVTNVKMGQQVTSLVTKDIFELIYASRRHMLTDLINQGKIAYQKGKRGSYIVGHRSILFNILPEDFCFTDFNIQVINSSKENLKLEKVQAIIPELVTQGILDPEVIMKVTMSDSPTEILNIINKSMAKRKEENNMIGQLQQQVEQLTQQTEEMQKALQQAEKMTATLQQKSDEIKQKELELEKKKVDSDINLGKRKQDTEDFVAREEVKKDKAIVQLEREQIYAEEATGNSREVKNNI